MDTPSFPFSLFGDRLWLHSCASFPPNTIARYHPRERLGHSEYDRSMRPKHPRRTANEPVHHLSWCPSSLIDTAPRQSHKHYNHLFLYLLCTESHNPCPLARNTTHWKHTTYTAISTRLSLSLSHSLSYTHPPTHTHTNTLTLNFFFSDTFHTTAFISTGVTGDGRDTE
ncbi:hypothetical protein LZ30DRAFT_742139 [Colletotrichum cereale]|nr:hypothetical protein LZ30DRAFT_742139 [Colletotrichum cereale]